MMKVVNANRILPGAADQQGTVTKAHYPLTQARHKENTFRLRSYTPITLFTRRDLPHQHP